MLNTSKQLFDKVRRSRRTANFGESRTATEERMAPFLMFVLENKVTLEGVQPELKLIADAPIVEHLSLSGTGIVAPGYAEMYFGPTWHPTTSFSLGVAAGIETADEPWRVAATVTASRDKLGALAIVEYGGSGLWYKGVVSYSVGPVGVGVLAQRFAGVGPSITGRYHGVALSVAPLYDFEARAPAMLVDVSWTP